MNPYARTEPPPIARVIPLILLLATTIAVMLPFIVPRLVDDSLVATMVPVMMVIVSLADIAMLRLALFPAVFQAYRNGERQENVTNLQEFAKAQWLLASMFVVSKGIYAVFAAVLTGVSLVAVPFGAIGLIEYAVVRSYLSVEIEKLRQMN
jgi:hypothetical protein